MENNMISQEQLDYMYDYGKDFVTRAYHRKRIDAILSLSIAFNVRGKTVIDVGCGEGAFVYSLSSHNTAIGIDLRIPRKVKVDFVRADAQHLPCRKDSFDAAICSEVLEEIDDERAALQNIHYVLKSHGLLICSMPNALSLFWGIRRAAIILRFRGRNHRLMRHTSFPYYRQLALAKESGFKVAKIRGAGVLPLWKPRKLDGMLGKLDEALGKSPIGRFAAFFTWVGFKEPVEAHSAHVSWVKAKSIDTLGLEIK
jgi:ubiquinone/menaquinone biosynthesis C-methylase UbiE